MAAYSADNTTRDAILASTLGGDHAPTFRDLMVQRTPAATGLAEAARRLSDACSHSRAAAEAINRQMQRVLDGGTPTSLAGSSDFMRYEQAQGEITAAREALSMAAFVYRES